MLKKQQQNWHKKSCFLCRGWCIELFSFKENSKQFQGPFWLISRNHMPCSINYCICQSFINHEISSNLKTLIQFFKALSFSRESMKNSMWSSTCSLWYHGPHVVSIGSPRFCSEYCVAVTETIASKSPLQIKMKENYIMLSLFDAEILEMLRLFFFSFF